MQYADKTKQPDGSPGYYAPNNIKGRELVPGVTVQVIWGERIMMGIITFAPNAVVPMHSHPHEQCGRMLSGTAWFELEGTEKTLLNPGDHYVIPGGVPHRVKATDEGCVALDIWSPIREEYIPEEIRFFKDRKLAPSDAKRESR